MKIFGTPLQNAVEQMELIAKDAAYAALMADHHLGYSMPIGGVAAYRGKVSPSGVGFDIACGNKAVKLNAKFHDFDQKDVAYWMDEIWNQISFGVGRKNNEDVDHELFDDPDWSVVEPIHAGIKDMARRQLGTVGSGNHYVDLFVDYNDGSLWCGVHFGSRGLGHKIASHFLKAAGGKDGINAPATLIDVQSELGLDYIAAMNLAGDYAYAGRDWVCNKVASIIGAPIVDEVHNHHNFAWEELHFGEYLWVHRKGATPARQDQRGFIGASMGETSYIVRGAEPSRASEEALFSTVHGAGRVLSRNQAAGKSKWKNGKRVKVSEGCVTNEMMMEWVNRYGIELRGGDTDESPHCYKRLEDVLNAQGSTIVRETALYPIGVAMAGDEFDPYKD